MAGFTQLPVHTQKLAAVIGLAVCVLAGAGLCWQVHRQAAEAQLREEASVAGVQAMTELVQRYRALQGAGAVAPLETDLSAVVTRSLQGKNFQPSRIQQQSGTIALRLDNAPFDEVLLWLNELEETGGVVVSTVSVTQSQPAGVTVTLALRGV